MKTLQFIRIPDQWLRLAIHHSGDFTLAGDGKFNGYPGMELRTAPEQNAALTEFFMQHIRGLLNARRVFDSISRFSMVTLQPVQLRPAHTLCHRDLGATSGTIKAACVLYLFKEHELGGTSFYIPKKSDAETAEIVQDSLIMTPENFSEKYGVARNYMHGSNDYFEQIGSVEAKWNRVVFYDGNMYHSGDILKVEKLSKDPQVGRLTINGFFSCSKKAV